MVVFRLNHENRISFKRNFCPKIVLRQNEYGASKVFRVKEKLRVDFFCQKKNLSHRICK